nr:hypothetical protein [Oscillospiraceae bacterium]
PDRNPGRFLCNNKTVYHNPLKNGRPQSGFFRVPLCLLLPKAANGMSNVFIVKTAVEYSMREMLK